MIVSRRKQVLYALLSFLTLVITTLSLPRAHQAQEQQPATLNSKPVSNESNATRQGGGTVVLTVTVMDRKGHYLDGLPRSAFTIMENKLPLEIASFHNDDVPSSLGVLFDDSGSMNRVGKERLAAVKDALTKFSQQGHSANQYFLMKFNDSPQFMADEMGDAKAFALNLAKLPAGDKALKGTTAFYDSCLSGLEKLAGGSRPKHALIVISDGLDSNSHHSFKDLREQLKRSNVLLYAVAINNPEQGRALLYESHEILTELTAITGGMAFFPESVEEINIAFAVIGLELRHQYSIGFKPPNQDAVGKWHSLKIKVGPVRNGQEEVKVSARSREGYYAP